MRKGKRSEIFLGGNVAIKPERGTSTKNLSRANYVAQKEEAHSAPQPECFGQALGQVMQQTGLETDQAIKKTIQEYPELYRLYDEELKAEAGLI